MSEWIDKLVTCGQDDPHLFRSLFPPDPYLGRLGDVSQLPHCTYNKIQEDCARVCYSDKWATGFSSLNAIICDLSPHAKSVYRTFWGQGFQLLNDPTEIWKVVLGQNPIETRYLARWLRHPILFYKRADTPWLLMQLIGGPCGVISVLQSHVFGELLFSPRLPEAGFSSEFAAAKVEVTQQMTPPLEKAASPATVAADDVRVRQISTKQKLYSTTPLSLRIIVSAAIARIIWQCGNNTKAVLCCLDALDAVKGGSVSELHTRTAGATMEGHMTVRDLATVSRIYYREFTSYAELVQHIAEHFLTLFSGPRIPGCLNLVLSCVQTRGCKQILTEDFDVFNEASLLADFGHCSQEMVNLLLIGAATPNTFDGERDTAGMKLKGVPHHSAMGQLSDMELMGYSAIGVRMKKPILPVWVVAKNYHFSTLCNLNMKSHKLRAREFINERLQWYWQQLDSEGMMKVDQAIELCDSLGIEDARKVVSSHLLDREIQRVLRDRFLTWGTDNVDKIPKLVEDLVTPIARLRMLPDEDVMRGSPCYLYVDGQIVNLTECVDDVSGCVVAKPTCARVMVPSSLVHGGGSEDAMQINQMLGNKESLTIFDFTVPKLHV